MSGSLILAVSFAYFAALFGLAMAIDRRASGWMQGRLGGIAYALSLTVYCTSWTFFGSVGRATVSGVGFLPVYLGPALVFLLGIPALRRLVAQAKALRTTSIADFISARHGNSRALAVLVTIVAVVGILPYISLQLKAVGTSLNVLLQDPDVMAMPAGTIAAVWSDPAFHTALVLAIFCMALATRHIDATEQHRGLVTIVALESVVKLLAFLAVGIFVTWGLFDGWETLFLRAASSPAAGLLDFGHQVAGINWWTVTLASALAVICLPRQFQVLVVENVRPTHLRTARWLFPLYLVLINLFVLPIALGGVLLLGGRGIPADTFVLALPILAKQSWLALFAFIGGISAATAMVLIEVTALATMVSNDLVLPVLLRRLIISGSAPVQVVKAIRRLVIVAILGLAYIYVRAIGESYTLVSIGLVSFVAAAQFAPALLGGLYLRRPSPRGAVMGLMAGFGIWLYTLLLPSFARSGWISLDLVQAGPFGIAGLAPHALFGVGGLDEISHALIWSLAANLGLYLTGMAADRRAAQPPLDRPARHGIQAAIELVALQAMVGRFIGTERAEQAFCKLAEGQGQSDGKVDGDGLILAEGLLAGVIGSASARIVMAAALDGEGLDAHRMRGMLKDASAAIESGRAIMADALDHLGQGVTVVDSALNLVAWNRRFIEMLRLPEEAVRHGVALEDIMRLNARNGEYGEGDVDELVAARLARLRNGHPFHDERERPDGSVLEVRGKPLPNGGFVTTYSDVTRRHNAERELRQAYDDLERRVEDRTRELSEEVRVRGLTEAALRLSRERLKGITDSLFEGVVVVDGEGTLTFANPSARRLLELTGAAGDIEGLPLDDLMRIRTPGGDVDFMESPFRQCLAAGTPARDDDAVFILSSMRTLAVAYACSPFGEGETKRGAIISFRDIEQLKIAQRELLQASRMASVGQLAAGIAHEINTPVQYVGDNLRFIEGAATKLLSVIAVARNMQSPPEEVSKLEAAMAAVKLPFLAGELPVAITEALDGVGQIARIVLSMKEFSHPGTSVRTNTDINRALASTLTVSHNVWKQVAEVETDFDPALPPLLCHAGELNQVFLNLIVNAAQAIEDSGKPLPGLIGITTSYTGSFIEIRVSDNGNGVPEGMRERIFDPFFTTKEVGKGTGQGLAICRDVVVVKHGGTLEVGGHPGKGAVFTIRLPVDSADQGSRVNVE